MKPGPGGLVSPGKPGGGGGAWKPPHTGHGHGHGHWNRPQWGYAAAGFAGVASVAYFARPVYTVTYEECEWVRVQDVSRLALAALLLRRLREQKGPVNPGLSVFRA